MTEGPSHVWCDECDNEIPALTAVYLPNNPDHPFCLLCSEVVRERREEAQWELHCSDFYGA